MDFMVRQNQDVNELKGTVNDRFNRVESAIMDNGVNIKELKVEHRELKNSVDTVITNHETRRRRLEEKAVT